MLTPAHWTTIFRAHELRLFVDQCGLRQSNFFAIWAIQNGTVLDPSRFMTEYNKKVILIIDTPDALHILDDLRTHASARSSFFIGVDGHASAGKTSFAQWLSSNLEMPVVSLDAYKIIDSGPAS